ASPPNSFFPITTATLLPIFDSPKPQPTAAHPRTQHPVTGRSSTGVLVFGDSQHLGWGDTSRLGQSGGCNSTGFI
ncbi:unnamed protein product, partial [Gulo gulo]